MIWVYIIIAAVIVGIVAYLVMGRKKEEGSSEGVSPEPAEMSSGEEAAPAMDQPEETPMASEPSEPATPEVTTEEPKMSEGSMGMSGEEKKEEGGMTGMAEGEEKKDQM